MSNADLPLKLSMRQAFWALGASTRVEVKLSVLIGRNQTRSRSGMQEWTDVDVLGVDYAPLTGLAYALADCKTLKGRVTERVFWLRGVADLFGARSSYMVRSEEFPPAARQLALRLGITGLDPRDLALLLEQAGDERLPLAGSFFEPGALAKWTDLLETTPRSIERLQRYRRAFFWLLPPQRNLVQLPSYLRGAAHECDPQSRWAQVLVVDMAWLYLLTVLETLERTTRLHLADPSSALQQTIVGGEPELRERQRVAEELRAVLAHVRLRKGEQLPGISVLPDYFDDLLDLLERLGRRRGVATEALRCLEFIGVETLALTGASWKEAFPNSSPLAVKLASDVLRFVVRTSGLSPEFVRRFDEVTRAPASSPAADRAPGLFDPPAANLAGAAADPAPTTLGEQSGEHP